MSAEQGQFRGDGGQGLLTDLYELTMAAAYFENHVDAPATFELFIRNLPPNRGYLLAAGLEQGLDYLEHFSFSPEQIDFLRRHSAFTHIGKDFFDFLGQMHFGGEVWAVPEGAPVFALEPLLRVTAPIVMAQIVETFLLATVTFETLIASKAARVVQSAGGRQVIEFGSRRAHGPQAGVLAARAAYIGGCAGSSNVEAHYCFGVPSFGTLAHSFVMAYESEEQSFREFNRVFPDHGVLLLDTYDTLAALDKVIATGLRPAGVRLDSGDLLSLSREVRKRLDRAGLTATRIVASGDLDEVSIVALLAADAPIDIFGVGTALSTSQDAPSLSGVYKLVEFAGRPRVKLGHDKASYPGRKQVFRSMKNDTCAYDIVGLEEESLNGEPLLACVMRNGERLARSPHVSEVRTRAAQSLQSLPLGVRALENPAHYSVQMSSGLTELRNILKSNLEEPALSKPEQD
jgi:nicotinate phosphoribosyltransferase